MRSHRISRPVGYAKGGPMGSVLPTRTWAGAPRFLVAALRDPEGANLDRVQIVKQWDGDEAARHERIFDVAVSGGRRIGRDGRCRKDVGDTVDVERATYTNTIGAAQLSAYWEDPDFDATKPAVYYVRVLEIPTPRWTTYDAARFGTPLPERVPATTRERAYTSPIWYEPGRLIGRAAALRPGRGRQGEATRDLGADEPEPILAPDAEVGLAGRAP
ncbi:MAG: DUF3604 domain-containing protein [Myxococcota bacterium]